MFAIVESRISLLSYLLDFHVEYHEISPLKVLTVVAKGIEIQESSKSEPLT